MQAAMSHAQYFKLEIASSANTPYLDDPLARSDEFIQEGLAAVTGLSAYV